MASPMNRHGRSSSTGLSNMKRPQNTKLAAQRLAQVMAHQPADDEDDDDDLHGFEPGILSVGIRLGEGRQAKSRSPMSVRTLQEPPQSTRSTISARGSTNASSVEQQFSARSTSGTRASATLSSIEKQPPSARSLSFLRPSNLKPVDLPTPILSTIPSSSFRPIESAEETQPLSARSNATGRSASYSSLSEQPPSVRFASADHPTLVIKTASTVPRSVPLSNKPEVSGVPVETKSAKSKDKRLSLDFGTFKYKDPSEQQSSSALQDELDMLQEENDNLLEKLRITEERCEEAEARTRQLEKQIASLGEGVSLEARLLSRKEADLQKREAALKVAAQSYGGGGEEIATLRMEAEAARDEATSTLEQLHDVKNEVNSLRTITQRTILTQEEMEEVVLKRCWLARCWSICLRHGIYAEIAGSRYEYWSSFASRPVEVILAAGQKAKDETSQMNSEFEEREKVVQDANDISKKTCVESMLLVEKGLRELNSLKVEEAIAISMALKRRPSFAKSNVSDELKLPSEGQYYSEAFELSPEESEDVLLKQAWLTYFWRRAKNHGLEPDIAEEKLQLWINKSHKLLNSHDAVDVERGLLELRKLGLETKLWEETRRLMDLDCNQQ
ncbi:coiled-coil domain-containing protein SCD2-like [Primulina eburnea]|uniref:coiled-coil domain-containing protein SCD2-like n=1 Tax=Primulina eburnea TaxID=1245227 RepID=UPI003C6C6F9F